MTTSRQLPPEQGGGFMLNGVHMNKKPAHFTKKKVIALAKHPGGIYEKVLLKDSRMIDNVNYFRYSKALDSNATEQAEPTTEPTTEPSSDEVRYEELKGMRAWLRPALKGEYNELKEKLNK